MDVDWIDMEPKDIFEVADVKDQIGKMEAWPTSTEVMRNVVSGSSMGSFVIILVRP